MRVAPLLLMLAAAPALANDSTASIAAGGLVLEKTDAIEMRSEDLYVSVDQVRVRYVFRNLTAKSVEVVVAFPMPPAPTDYEGDFAMPSDFRTTVDGRPVKTALKKVGAGKSAQDHHWWRQSFPAGRDITIEHRYIPGTGGSVQAALAIPDYRRSAEGRREIALYCADRQFLAALDRLSERARPMPESRIDYTLTTGANWAKPIGDFRLVVDKGSPANLVSFCGEGVRKIGPTRFEVRHRNWRPTNDLHILIVSPSG